MRHHTYHVALLVGNTCNIIQRPVRVACICEYNLIIRLQLCHGLFVTVVITFTVCNRNNNFFTLGIIACKRSLVVLHAKHRIMTKELKRHIPAQRAWQQSGFGKNLESIADSQNVLALLSSLGYFSHHRSKS
ncbi:hypothetical protein D3C81_1771120 [compost metagenome]